MGPVYATRLTILPDDDHPMEVLHDHAVEVCHRWLISVGQRYGITVPPSFDSDAKVSNTDMTASITAEHVRQDDDRVWRAIITHPYSPNGVDVPYVQFRVEIQARDAHGEEVVTIRLLLGSLVDRIRPLTYYLKSPRLIRDILSEFDGVSVGNVHATVGPRHLGEAEVATFAHDLILRPDRSIPVIVVSRTEDESLLCDPDAIAMEVAGLSRVYILPSYESAFALTEALHGKQLSCYNGAIRLYWPDCGITDPPHNHPLWLADRIRDNDLATRLPGRLFSMISAASTLGITSDTKAWELYRASASAKIQARTQKLLDRAEMMAKEKIAATEADYYDAIEQMEQIQNQLNEQTGEMYRLESERETLHDRVDEARNRSVALMRRALGCRRLVDVVELVQEISDESYLWFLPEAMKSARSAPYRGSMISVLDMLLRIRAVAKRYYEQSDDGMGFLAMFNDEGESGYATSLSDTSRGQYRDDYERSIVVGGKSRKILCDHHVGNGGGAPKNTVMVYWHADSENRRFIVGHVGRHLRGKQPT